MSDKACPVVTRVTDGLIEILAFQHPNAGQQLVKGTIERGEQPSDAAVRELAEESGLVATGSPFFLTQVNNLPVGDTWFFYDCEVKDSIPEDFSFFTQDEGGLWFRFFWHDVNRELNEKWHPLFHDVMAIVRPLIMARYG